LIEFGQLKSAILLIVVMMWWLCRDAVMLVLRGLLWLVVLTVLRDGWGR